MSIALSAVIASSRTLRRVRFCYGVANLGAGAVLAAGQAHHDALAWLAVAASWLAGVRILSGLGAGLNVRRIDISGLGKLRLTVQQGIGRPAAAADMVQLLAGSTLWPGMMVLRLRQQNGVVRALVLFPDSVEAGQFRRLSVAMRDVASRKI